LFHKHRAKLAESARGETRLRPDARLCSRAVARALPCGSKVKERILILKTLSVASIMQARLQSYAWILQEALMPVGPPVFLVSIIVVLTSFLLIMLVQQ
jgi:hypothetical protein